MKAYKDKCLLALSLQNNVTDLVKIWIFLFVILNLEKRGFVYIWIHVCLLFHEDGFGTHKGTCLGMAQFYFV